LSNISRSRFSSRRNSASSDCLSEGVNRLERAEVLGLGVGEGLDWDAEFGFDRITMHLLKSRQFLGSCLKDMRPATRAFAGLRGVSL
jgi:hypothetical protein